MNEIFVSIEDLKTLFKRLRYKLQSAAILCALGMFLFCLSKEPLYIAEATFRQSTGRVEQSIDLKNFVKTMMSADVESSTVALMFSQKILRRVVENLGLQAQAHSSKSWNFLDNLRAEFKFPLPDLQSFSFSHVIYEQETPLAVFVRFLSPDSYEILDQKGEKLAAACLGERIDLDAFKLNLDAPPKNVKIGKKYPLLLLPWKPVVAAIKSRLAIKPTKLDKSVLQIGFSHRDRLLSARLINELMSSYQVYLKEENDMLAKAQLAYLSKRQEEVGAELDKTLQQHVAYLKGNIGRMGFIELDQGASSLSNPHEEYTSKLFNVEYELARLEKTQDEQIASGKAKIEEALLLLQCLEKGEPLPALKTTLAALVQELKNTETPEEARHAKHHLRRHLSSMIQSMHRHQKVLKEVPEADMRGIDLATAKDLYIRYSNELDSLRVNTHQLQFFLIHLKEPDFELSSLCRILTDSITEEMVQKAGGLELQLQDELTHSGKEHERVREALSTQKRFIAHHLSQTIELEKIHIDLVQEKLFTLQKSMIDLLKNEKHLIEDKLASLRESMTDLPEKWRLENTLKFKTELTQSMMEGLSQFSESKNLSSHLYQVESKPLDHAFIPSTAKSPNLVLSSLGGGVFGAFLLYLFFLVRSLVKGLPISLNHLKILNIPTCGRLSSADEDEFSESDLETLRRMTSFVLAQSPPSLIALVGESNPNISQNLAELLSLRGPRTVVLECDFSAFVSLQDTPGIWQFLTGEIPHLPIHKMGNYDLIKTGRSSSKGAELLSQERFALALKTLKLDYDYILLFSKASLTSTETEELLKCADAAAIFVADETLAEIEPLRKWSRQKENPRLVFVKCEASLI